VKTENHGDPEFALLKGNNSSNGALVTIESPNANGSPLSPLDAFVAIGFIGTIGFRWRF
jgi:hypothetical protein